ncbi:trypsin-like serine peptidase [Aliikangiella maris]|uniref:Serine protease n=2 Tax=Aliikangiella maris TaxID=3162458 RepID=A0ABV2BZ21_9GAMM
MRKLILLLYCNAIAFLLLTSCTSVPIRIEEPQQMFTDAVPSNICYLRTVRSVRFLGFRLGFNSTGTLIEGQYLITAAHNLYDSWQTKLVSVQVSCMGSNGNVVTTVVGQSGIEKTRKVSHYNLDFSTDYAFLKLDVPVSVVDSVTFNGSVNISDIPTVEVAGYPGGQLKYGAGKIVQPIPNDSTFYYEIDTIKGMSGGPVWATFQNAEYLVGVHVSEGRARTVNKELINDFESWKASFQ